MYVGVLEGRGGTWKDTRSLRYSISLRPRNQMGARGGGEKHLLTSLLTVFLFTQVSYGNISTWHLCGILRFERLLTRAWRHLICKAFDLYGISSDMERSRVMLVFEGEDGPAIAGAGLRLYTWFSIRLTLFVGGQLCLWPSGNRWEKQSPR